MPAGSEDIGRAANVAALSCFQPVERSDPPVWSITLWPHRSLGAKGFRNVMWLAGAGLMIPVLPLFFTPAGWALLPFAGGVLILLWLAFRANYRHARLEEHVNLWPDLIAVERYELNGEVKRWQANPYWMRSRLLEEGGPVANYLTLIGSEREIELGAFLSPEERVRLQADIEAAIRGLERRQTPNA